MIKEDQRFCASGATLKSAFDETHVCVSSQEDSWKQTEEVAVYLIPVALGWLKSLTMREEKLDGKGGAVLRKQNTPGASDRSLYLILQKALQNRCFHWLVFFFIFIYLFIFKDSQIHRCIFHHITTSSRKEKASENALQ